MFEAHDFMTAALKAGHACNGASLLNMNLGGHGECGGAGEEAAKRPRVRCGHERVGARAAHTRPKHGPSPFSTTPHTAQDAAIVERPKAGVFRFCRHLGGADSVPVPTCLRLHKCRTNRPIPRMFVPGTGGGV